MDTTNPDSFLRMTKKGKGVMMFVDLKPEVSEEQAEVVMRIWQSSLQNNHIIAERYFYIYSMHTQDFVTFH